MMKALSRMRLDNSEHFFTTDTKLSGSRVDEPMKKETLAIIKKTVSNQILRALENEGVSFSSDWLPQTWLCRGFYDVP